LSKNPNFLKNQSFVQKFKFSQKIEIISENRNSFRKSNFSPKIQILSFFQILNKYLESKHLEKVRIYDYGQNRLKNFHETFKEDLENYKLDDCFAEMSTLSEIHLKNLNFNQQKILKSLFAEYDTLGYHFKSFSK